MAHFIARHLSSIVEYHFWVSVRDLDAQVTMYKCPSGVRQSPIHGDMKRLWEEGLVSLGLNVCSTSWHWVWFLLSLTEIGALATNWTRPSCHITHVLPWSSVYGQGWKMKVGSWDPKMIWHQWHPPEQENLKLLWHEQNLVSLQTWKWHSLQKKSLRQSRISFWKE